MIYFLSNIFFGHPKLSKYQLDFFNNYFIPHIQNPQKIIISGNLFYNINHISFQLLNDVKHIFNSIDIPIEIVENNYCFDIIKNFGNITQIDKLDKVNDFSLFQFSKDNKEKIGFYINDKFKENKHSPKFIEYTINSLKDLDNIKITKDFIDLTINSELLEKAEYKNKIDLFLNNNSFNNVFYTEKNKNIEKVKMKDNDIRNILIDNIDDDLKEELKEIFTIYDEKKAG